MRRVWCLAVGLAVGAVLAGCQAQTPRKLVPANPPQAQRSAGLSQVETVLVLPFGNESAYPEAQEDVEKAVVEEVAKVTGLRLRASGAGTRRSPRSRTLYVSASRWRS